MTNELSESKCRKSSHLIHSGIRVVVIVRVVRIIALSFRVSKIRSKITKQRKSRGRNMGTTDLLTQLRVIWLINLRLI